jgi:hypothetical protein
MERGGRKKEGGTTANRERKEIKVES